MNFLICAPGDYTPNGGGCVALHRLAHNISLCGEKCYIMTSKKNPAYLGEEVTEQQAKRIAKDGAFTIYPEVTCGNPLGAVDGRIMRWILYYVRNYGEHGKFGERDLIYKFAPHFTLRYEQETHGELRAVELNLHTFYNYNVNRSGACYLVKKNPDKVHIHPEGSLCLDDYPKHELNANFYLAGVFNTHEMFIAYDSATWLSVMAALCGCVSVVIPDEGVTAEEWHSKFPYFKYGIAYGMDDIQYAKDTQHLLRDELIKIESETIEQTVSFIKMAYGK